MRVLDADFMNRFIRMCEDGWLQGWHECHGGNLTYRLTEAEAAAVRDDLTFSGDWTPIGVEVPGLAGAFFLSTASGQIFRNTALEPEISLGVVEISEDGRDYRKCWGFENGGRPTSEFPSHLMNHEIKKQTTGGRHRIIYHAHPENIIALSFVLPLTDEVFTRELWEMMPECAMTFPDGMGVLPWMIPGTGEIALATGEKMRQYDVVLWAQHGIFSSGESMDAAFGLVHTIEKAAGMLLKVLAVRPDKLQVPSVQNFRDMARAFHLNLPERFLYEKNAGHSES